MANSSDLSFDSSEVSFDSSEEFFLSSRGNRNFLGNYLENSSEEIRINRSDRKYQTNMSVDCTMLDGVLGEGVGMDETFF